MKRTRLSKKSSGLILMNRILLPVGYLMLFAGIGCLLYTFTDLYILLKQAQLSSETITPLLPIFIVGVILLVVGGFLIKSAKAVLDRPF